MMSATFCPTANQLKALSLGQLPEDQSDDLFMHVSTCESCQSELETVGDGEDSLISSLRSPYEFEQLEAEPDCQRALVKALDALTSHTSRSTGESEQLILPQNIGEYVIVRPLGRGGMGSVFLAQHTKLGRQVALKILSSHRLADPRMRERFEAEMRAVGKLSHPNIVAAHDAREVDGTLALVTEFIDGYDLEQLVARTGPLSIANACELVRQVAVALAYTSQLGFVHRDVKPSNIMLSHTGEVKLLDLGLARLQYASGEPSDITATGQAMGTADYIAPEQVTDSRSVDVRADIYALGCTLYKLLTGHAPFAGSLHETVFAKMTAHVSQQPPSLSKDLPHAPSELVRLVGSMLAKSVEDRPQQPELLAERLKEFSKGTDLEQLARRAASLAEIPPIIREPLSRRAAGPSHSFWRRPVSKVVAVASGFFGILVGMCLGIMIVITNPDGTQTIMELAAGSKVEVRESISGSNETPAGSATFQSSKETSKIEWLPYSDANLKGLFKLNRPVVVLFTAQWDLTGQTLKRSIEDEVGKHSGLTKDVDFVLADWTQPSEAISAKLEELNHKSVPLLVIYSASQRRSPTLFSNPQVGEVITELQGLVEQQRSTFDVRKTETSAEIPASQPQPLQFALFMHQELSGVEPSIRPGELAKLFRIPITATLEGNVRWLLVDDPTLSELPIERIDKSGQRYALVSTVPKFSIAWDEIEGHISELKASGKSEHQPDEVNLKFTENLGARMLELTAAGTRQRLAIIVNNKVLTAPLINSPIGSQVMITGVFSDTELQRLRSGLVAAQLATSADLSVKTSPAQPPLAATGLRIEGVVRLDGKPLAKATVTFVPRGEGHPFAAQTDSDGVFVIDGSRRKTPISPGEHWVRISKTTFAYREVDGKQFVAPEETIPSRYNRDSVLEYTFIETAKNIVHLDLSTDVK